MFVVGSLLPWKLATIPGFSFPLCPILLAWLLPESPTWLVSRYTQLIMDLFIVDHVTLCVKGKS